MNDTALDPAIGVIVRAGFALLFARAAAHKLRDRSAFRYAVASYRLVPGNWTSAVANLLVGAEIAIAAALCVPAFGRVASLGAAGLLLTYGAAIGANLLRGIRDIDCGCTAASRNQPLRAGLVVRNLVLVGLALAGAMPAAARALTWLDAITAVAAVAAAALLYGAAEGLLAGSERSQALARRAPLEAGHA
jgi:methylamine utilization protein MauE